MPKKFLPSLALLMVLLWASPAEAKTPIVVRVGIVAVQNFESTYSKYEDMFSRLSTADSEYDITFMMAVGTYGEVMDWYGKKLIDVAVLTPGPVAELLTMPNASELLDSYIATHVLKPAKDPLLAQADRVEGKTKFQYRAVAIVGAQSCTSDTETKLCDYADLKRLADKGRVRFLFVHPLSVSGFILPSFVLRNNGVDVSKNTIEWTHTEEKSLERVGSPPEDDKVKVAFVWDGVEPDHCKVEIKKLVPPNDQDYMDIESFKIPQEVVLLSTSLRKEEPANKTSGYKNKFDEYKPLLEKLLTDQSKNTSKELSFAVEKDWQNSFYNVKGWLGEQSPTVSQRALYGVNLNDLGTILSSYKKSHRLAPVRLALVLSGGGAKCAYQLGAIEALEQKLQEMRDRGERDMDIGLVVGTSGGAINALTVALGVSKDRAGQQALHRTWKSFNQKNFFQPWPAISFFYGLFWGMVQASLLLVVILGLRFLFNRTRGRWWLAPAILISAIGLGELLLSRFISWSPWEATGEFWRSAQFFQHFWLLVILVSYWAAPWLLMIGTTMMIVGWLIEHRGRSLSSTSGVLNRALVVVLLIDALALIYLIIDFINSMAQWEGRQLWVTFICFIIIVGLLSATLLILLYLKKLIARRNSESVLMREIIARPTWVNAMVITIVALLANMAIIAALTLRYEISLSNSSGIESAMVENIPTLLPHQTILSRWHPDLIHSPALVYERRRDLTYKDQLKHISEWIIEQKQLQRDLVITVSRLPSEYDHAKTLSHNKLPSDLYFYYSRKPESFMLDSRYVSLNNSYNQKLLMDVVIGSSSIYPVFPPRKLERVWTDPNPPSPQQMIKDVESSSLEQMKSGDPKKTVENVHNMDVIDGGYIHNSPIDAALRWKPTHIVLIEASPQEQPPEPRNFVDSSITAFNYLFYQAQRLDTQLKGQVDIFELRPASTCTGKPFEDPSSCTKDQNLDTFDFSPNRVEMAIQRGLNDARSNEARFLRLPGLPQFRDVPSERLVELKYRVFCVNGKIVMKPLTLEEMKLADKSASRIYLIGEYDTRPQARKAVRKAFGGFNSRCEVCPNQ